MAKKSPRVPASPRESENEDGTPGLVPKLRFPEFRDLEDWICIPLAKVCDVLQGYGFPESIQGKTSGRYPFCKVSDISKAVSQNGGLVTEAANYIDEFEVRMLRAKLVPAGATVFAKIGEALRLNRRAFVQTTCLIDNNAVGLKGIEGRANDYFVYLLSQLINLNDHCGGAVPSVNKTTLEQIRVSIPKLEEQHKIASCLSSLDELIGAQGRKVDALRTHKKGLMQQLFPREGETQPRLRFPEFQDSPEWDCQPLGEIFETTTGGTPSRAEKTYWNGDIPWITTSLVDFRVITEAEEFITKEGLDNSSAKLFPKGTVLMALYGQGKTRGQVALLSIQATTNQACSAILPRKGIDPYFLFLNLAGRYEEIRSMSNSGGQENLSQSLVREIPFAFPTDPNEQAKITSALRSLDDLINAETQKLEALKTHKRGLMQQLFPSPEEN